MELLFVFISFLTAAGISFFAKQRENAEYISLAAAVIAMLASFFIALKVAGTGQYSPLPLFFIDALGAVILLITSCVGVATVVYSIPYLRRETVKNIIGFKRVKQYFFLQNVFFAALFLAVAADSPIFAFIAIEATTLSTAFLISFYNKPSTIEAAWKYIIINSVGLLLGFFGTLLYFTPFRSSALNGAVSWQFLMENAINLDPVIVKIAFIFVIIGYGTKVGFAPMHTWKPDAYSKAPAPLGAMLSGAVLPVAFLILLKFKKITDISLGPLFSEHLFIVFGLLSISIAAVIMFSSKNYKRLLAYSCIENAGIMALGFGFGGLGIFAALLHMIYHSCVKVILFFSAGNLLLKYHSARIANIKGALNILPVTSVLFISGFLIVTGLPPFGTFLTKLFILSAGINTHPVITVLAVFFMTVVFIGFLKHVTAMFFGLPAEGLEPGEGNIWLVIPSCAFLTLVVILSFYIPPFLYKLISESALRY